MVGLGPFEYLSLITLFLIKNVCLHTLTCIHICKCDYILLCLLFPCDLLILLDKKYLQGRIAFSHVCKCAVRLVMLLKYKYCMVIQAWLQSASVRGRAD